MKDQSFANLNLATGIPSIYMCVNMNIKKLKPAKQLQLTFMFYLFLILLVFSLAPALSLSLLSLFFFS